MKTITTFGRLKIHSTLVMGQYANALVLLPYLVKENTTFIVPDGYTASFKVGPIVDGTLVVDGILIEE